MNAHSFQRIEEHGDEFVLVCECGWRSDAAPTAEAVGAAWDEHRQRAGVRSS